MGTTPIFIAFIGFLLFSLVSSSLIVFLGYSFLILPFFVSFSFSILLFHSASLLCSLRCHILLQNCFFPCHQVVGMSSCNFPYLLVEHFLLFSNILFCLYCFILSRYLSPVLSGLFHRVVLFFNRVTFSLFVSTCFSVFLIILQS